MLWLKSTRCAASELRDCNGLVPNFLWREAPHGFRARSSNAQPKDVFSLDLRGTTLLPSELLGRGYDCLPAVAATAPRHMTCAKLMHASMRNYARVVPNKAPMRQDARVHHYGACSKASAASELRKRRGMIPGCAWGYCHQRPGARSSQWCPPEPCWRTRVREAVHRSTMHLQTERSCAKTERVQASFPYTHRLTTNPATPPPISNKLCSVRSERLQLDCRESGVALDLGQKPHTVEDTAFPCMAPMTCLRNMLGARFVPPSLR